MAVKQCKICSTSFVKNRRQIYCSIKCQQVAWNIKSGNRYVGPREISCPNCNNIFHKPFGTNRIYCSKKCQRSFHEKKFIENHPNYRKPRAKKWYQENKEITIKRSYERQHGEKREEVLQQKKQYYEENKERFREIENKRRTKLGLPLIGEGWISEQQMINIIVNLFPNESMKLHDRTELYGLELDVFLPDRKLAFEYNGEQHYMFSTRFHKSEQDFIDQQKRDVEKRARCREQGIKLIILRYDEEISEQLILSKLAEKELECAQTWL